MANWYLCVGELAGNLSALGQILQTGICSISVPTPLIPVVKEHIRNLLLDIPNTEPGEHAQ